MATVNVKPASLAAGAVSMTGIVLATPSLITPSGIATGAPVLGDARIVILHKPWPFRPKMSVSETLEWSTTVLGSYTGEQRIAARKAPRQLFTTTVRLDDARFVVAKTLARVRAGTLIGLPIWPEVIDLTSNLASTDTSVSIDTTYGDWRVDGGILLWESPEKYVIKRILTVTDDSIGLMGTIGVDLTRPAVVPLRSAFTPEGFSIDRQTTYSDIEAKFQVTDNIDLSASYVTAYPQYLSLDIVTEAPFLVTNVSDSIVRATDYIDNGTGPVKLEALKNYVDFGQTVSFMEERAGPLWKRRLWLHSLRGKQKPFWLPSFNADLALKATIGAAATTMTVASIGPVADYEGRHFVIKMKSGTPRYANKITSATSLGNGQDQLTLSSAIGAAIDPDDVAMISFLSKMRLNSDSVAIDHRYALESTVAIPVIGVPA